MNILHVAKPEKFTIPFFRLIQKKLNVNKHAILSYDDGNAWGTDIDVTNVTSRGAKWLLDFFILSNKADKIILHGLFDGKIILFLFIQPWLLKKCYWIILGGDLYTYQSDVRNLKWKVKEFFRKTVIKKMGHLVTYINGDVALARDWYGAQGAHHNSIVYTSNVYQDYDVQSKCEGTKNIQVGNSADRSNHHIEVFQQLLPYRELDILIYVPLSYGDKEYAEYVIAEGTRLFGAKLKPMTDFMPFDQYLEFLGDIDIAIFNHDRQQAMGNIITLLGLGKKVFIREGITPWNMFKSIRVKVFSTSDIELSEMDSDINKCNQAAIRKVFSEVELLMQLKKLFEG